MEHKKIYHFIKKNLFYIFLHGYFVLYMKQKAGFLIQFYVTVWITFFQELYYNITSYPGVSGTKQSHFLMR